jgi:hypothetical protein
MWMLTGFEQNHFETPENRTIKYFDNDRRKIAVISLIGADTYDNAAAAYGNLAGLELGNDLAVKGSECQMASSRLLNHPVRSDAFAL